MAAALPVTAGSVYPAHARPAADVEFSEEFAIGLGGTDISRFRHGNPIEAGIYNVDVTLNNARLRRMDIPFVDSGVPHAARACLPVALLHELGLKDSYLQRLEAGDPAACPDLPGLVEGASVSYNDSALQLDISLPQIALQRTARGFVAPELRDHGVPAVFVDYSANRYRSNGSTSSYLGLNVGLNMGAWRLRQRSAISHSRHGTTATVPSRYLQRDLPRWNSQLMLGQGNTGGQLFDSVAFTGLRVATDERMLPDSLRGYAPVVRGVAQGNARITIRQNGGILYETTVAPGPFAIDDLYPTSGGGDLEVTLTEADGREERFSVAFSAVPQALREDSQSTSATVGQLRGIGNGLEPLRFAEATFARGINNRLTLLSGAQLADGYRAGLLGVALNSPIGAFGIDATRASMRLPVVGALDGRSYRMTYQRSVAITGTSFGLAAHRYSTAGYLGLADAARLLHGGGSVPNRHAMRPRTRVQINVFQRAGEHSQIYLNGGRSSYWNGSGNRGDLQLGFHSQLKRASYGVSATRYRSPDDTPDTRLGFTLSLPLGNSATAPRVNGIANQSRLGQHHQIGVSGALGTDRALSYSLGASQGNGSSAYNGHASYAGSFADLNAGFGRSNGSPSMNLGAAGSVVVHGGGINAGPRLGESFALVQAKGAEGARTGNGRGVTVADNGYAVLPFTSPYRWNTVDLNTAALPLDIEVDGTSRRVAPTAGSIVKVTFATRNERLLFIDATDADGQPLPFAAPISDADGRPLGHVGQGGMLQLRGMPAAGSVRVNLGEHRHCRLSYTTPGSADSQGLYWTRARCETQSAAPPPAFTPPSGPGGAAHSMP